jgi:hypothetical protein
MAGKDEDDFDTDRLTPVRPLQLVQAAVVAMKTAETELGRLGDMLHDLRRDVEKARKKLEELIQ